MTYSTVLPQPLITGQRMSREEFICRWENLPGLKNAELIEGVVYVPSPVSIEHGDNETSVAALFRLYAWNTPGCKAVTNSTWLMLDSAPQPDIALAILPEYGGQSRIEKYGENGPELVVEICVTSTEVDFGPKLALYQRAEVREYVTIESLPRRITWRVLRDGSYSLLVTDSDDTYRSRVFPGLWLNAAAFWADDGLGLMAVLQQGLASEEHAEFVDQLSRRLRT